MSRWGCFFSNIWYGLWAPWDGAAKGGEFGWRVAPRFGLFLDMLSCWFLPFLCAGVCGTFGATLGGFALSGSVVEALAQFFVADPL